MAPTSAKPVNTLPSRLVRKCWFVGVPTLFEIVPGASELNTELTDAWVGFINGALAGRLAVGSLCHHVALPNANAPPGVLGFAMSATRQSRCQVYSFVRVSRDTASMMLPRSSAEFTPKRP